MMEFRRVTEDEVADKVDLEIDVGRWFVAMTPKEAALVLALADGMTVGDIENGFGITRQAIWLRLKRAKEKAEKVFGQDAVRGRLVHERK